MARSVHRAGEDDVVRIARSTEALERILASAERGPACKPDWIHLQGECRLDRIADDAREALLARLHRCVKRGFRANNVQLRRRRDRVALWRQIARHGFHDFCDDRWMKCYDSPFVENYDYLAGYFDRGVEGLDPYQVYSAVLGTHEYSAEDFLHTKLCANVRTIVEPMAGSAEFAYQSHFRYPEFRYVMFDLDERAREHVMARPWLPETEHHYVVANALDDAIWKQVKSLSSGESLSYIGKQSHNFFDAKQLYRLLELGTRHVDYFVLETPQVSLITDCDEVEDLSRPEMEDAGFEVALVDEPDTQPNPLTNELHFRLDVWDDEQRRTLFRYDDWTSWPHPTLVSMARLLDLRALYFHSELEEFVPVEEGTEDSDCLENVTFMLFTRHAV